MAGKTMRMVGYVRRQRMAGTMRGKETGIAGRATMNKRNGNARKLLIVTSMTWRDPILCRYEHQAQTSQEQKKTAAPHHDYQQQTATTKKTCDCDCKRNRTNVHDFLGGEPTSWRNAPNRLPSHMLVTRACATNLTWKRTSLEDY